MCQSDQFIEVFNRFRTATHNFIDITFLNNICLCQPPNELDFLSMYEIQINQQENAIILFLKIQIDKNMFLMLMTNTMTHAPNMSN